MVNVEVKITSNGVVIKFERKVGIRSIKDTFTELGELIHSALRPSSENERKSKKPKLKP